jgi:hypothetical protein
MVTEYQSFKFQLSAGSPERRVLMHDIAWWLRIHIGDGRFIVDSAHDDYGGGSLDWYILTSNDCFRVWLREESSATLFALKWQ